MQEVRAVQLLEKLLDELRDQDVYWLPGSQEGLETAIEFLESDLTPEEFIKEQE